MTYAVFSEINLIRRTAQEPGQGTIRQQPAEPAHASGGAAGAVFLTSDAGATKERRGSEEGRQRLPSGPERAS
jgi:hypothetical protein